MNNAITNLEISNFKSIKHIQMDCKRINVLIGKPNVGKSNILEALCLYLAPLCDPQKKIFSDYIRYEKMSNLLYDQDRKSQVIVNSNLGFASLRYHMNNIDAYDLITGPDISILDTMNQSDTGNTLHEKERSFYQLIAEKKLDFSKGIVPDYRTISNEGNQQTSTNNSGFGQIVKKYHFKPQYEFKNHFPSFLFPPYGDNLFTILEENRDLWDECAAFFNEYGLDMLLDLEFEKIDVQKKIGRYVTKVPYSLAADTLQRIIFHLAAIETNKDSILLFEEPENHSFPPYIKLLAENIIESESNQFFIATHSPYILTTLIEQCPVEDLSIFIASYENYETKIKLLTDKEIQNILDTHIDLFFNIRAFEK